MKGKKTGGRQKGTPNKMTGAHGDFLSAWEKCAGPETAQKIMRAAIQEAIGREVPLVVSGVPIMGVDGKPMMTRSAPNFEPLRSLLPYIARKMPETLENILLPTMSVEEAAAAVERLRAEDDGEF